MRDIFYAIYAYSGVSPGLESISNGLEGKLFGLIVTLLGVNCIASYFFTVTGHRSSEFLIKNR